MTTFDYIEVSTFECIAYGVLFAALFLVLIGRRTRGTVFKWTVKILKWSAKWITISLAALAVLLFIFYAEEDWRGKRAWENYKRQLEARGEKLDWKDFIPPPVPDDQNFALTPIVASAYEQNLDTKGHFISPPDTNVVDRLQMTELGSLPWNFGRDVFGNWQMGKKIDLKAWQTYFREALTNGTQISTAFPTAPKPQTPAADVLLALSKYDSAIEELRQASRLPYSRFPVNYNTNNPYDPLGFLPLGSFASSMRVLRLRAVAELENGQSEKALTDEKLILYLANSVQNIKLLYLQQERAQILSLAIQPIWEGLIEHQWSANQLAEIQQGLSTVDLLSDYDTAARGSLAKGLMFIEYERRNHDSDHQPEMLYLQDEVDFKVRMARLYHHLFPEGWYYQNETVLTRVFEQSARTKDEVKQRILSPEIAQRCNFCSSIIDRHYNSPHYFYGGWLFPLHGRAVMIFSFEQTSIDLARVACALERYRLAHGEYPETLNALVPQFMKAVPNDIINGQPLHYHRTSNGKFLLYSIGWNEKDDGGQIAQNEYGSFRYEKGDWVWPN